MWIATKHGFYSVVQKEAGVWHVRARLKRDIENLATLVGFPESEVQRWDGADYRWRIVVENVWTMTAIFQALCASITYPNFKAEIAATPDQKDKLPAYHDIWHRMHDMQRMEKLPDPKPAKRGRQTA